MNEGVKPHLEPPDLRRDPFDVVVSKRYQHNVRAASEQFRRDRVLFFLVGSHLVEAGRENVVQMEFGEAVAAKITLEDGGNEGTFEGEG